MKIPRLHLESTPVAAIHIRAERSPSLPNEREAEMLPVSEIKTAFAFLPAASVRPSLLIYPRRSGQGE